MPVEEIFCVLVNDVYVAKVWGESTGATKAGIKIITDPLSILAETLDMEFTVKGTGLLRRLQRFTAVIKNKKIDILQLDLILLNCYNEHLFNYIKNHIQLRKIDKRNLKNAGKTPP